MAGSVREVDYYELLGVPRDASVADIRAAYRSLAKLAHPDTGGTTSRFHLLRQAYETLLDPSRRAAHDRLTAGSGVDGGIVAARVRASTATRSRPGSRSVGADPDFTSARPRLDKRRIPWWRQVDPGARVRYVPTPAFGSAPGIAAVLFALLLVLPAVVPLDFPPWLLALWMLLLAAEVGLLVVLARRYRAATRQEAAVEAEFGVRVHGEPSAEPDQHVNRLTAELLANYLTRFPAARIFHGLCLPGSVFADVDHAVLCGTRLVLVESKSWLPGHYTADPTGQLWRNGHRFRGGVSGLVEAVAAYRAALPELDVRGVVVVYPNRPGDVTTGGADEAEIPVMTPEQLVHTVGSRLAPDPVTLDRAAFLRIRGLVAS